MENFKMNSVAFHTVPFTSIIFMKKAVNEGGTLVQY